MRHGGSVRTNSVLPERINSGTDMCRHIAQDDLLYESLTVWEVLYYAAMLRLPRTMSHEDKKERVRTVIRALGIWTCKDTIIGAVFASISSFSCTCCLSKCGFLSYLAWSFQSSCCQVCANRCKVVPPCWTQPGRYWPGAVACQHQAHIFGKAARQKFGRCARRACLFKFFVLTLHWCWRRRILQEGDQWRGAEARKHRPRALDQSIRTAPR